MKKKIFTFFMAVALIGIGIMCPVTSLAAKRSVGVKSINLSKTSITLTVKGTYTLKATINPSNASNKTVKWSSSDAKIASVSSSGKVTAVKAGSCTITAKSSNNKTAKCSVKVNAPVTVSSIKAVSVSTTVGTAPKMPSTVTAVMSDKTTKKVSVNWDYIDKSQYAKENTTFTVKGTIKESSTIKATATVTVTMSDSSFEDYLDKNYGSLTIDGKTINFNWNVNNVTTEGYDVVIDTIIDNHDYENWINWCSNKEYSTIKSFLYKINSDIQKYYPNKTFVGDIIFSGYFYGDNPSKYFDADEYSWDNDEGAYSVTHVPADFYSTDGKTTLVDVQDY